MTPLEILWIIISIKEAKTSFKEIKVWTSFLLCSSFVCVVSFFFVLNVLKLVWFINAIHILISAAIACAFSVLVNLNPVRYTLCLYSPPFINPPKTLYKVVQAQASNVSIYCLVFFLSGMCLQLYMLHCVVMLVTKMWINITVTVNLSKLLAWFSVAQN